MEEKRRKRKLKPNVIRLDHVRFSCVGDDLALIPLRRGGIPTEYYYELPIPLNAVRDLGLPTHRQSRKWFMAKKILIEVEEIR